MKLLTQTNSTLTSISLLLLRCTLGIILFMVGAGKVFGWFGGYGLGPTIHAFVTMMHIPAPLAYLSTFTELIGGALLIVGLLTRPAALAVFINMAVATVIMWPKGFIGSGVGAAWPFSLMISALAILLSGPMAYSIDSLLARRVQPTMR